MSTSEVERFWEELCGQVERRWSGRPDPVLVEVASPLSPGTALDLGFGEGADAVAPGGLLLVVDHAAAPPWTGGDAHEHEHLRFPTPEEVLTGLDLPRGRWTTERAELHERQATGADGRIAVLVDSVVAVRLTG